MTNTANVNDQQVERLRHAIEPTLDTPYQEPDRWRRMSNNDLWFAVFGQVAVVGGAAGGDRLLGDPQARRELSWSRLSKLDDDDEARTAIWEALRRHGVRYVAGDVYNDRKSAALPRNLRVLEAEGGPKKFFAQMVALPSEAERVRVVARILSFVKHKGARDLLINLGMCSDMIAFDVRLQKVLTALGVEGANFNKAEEYDALEDAFRAAVLSPGVSCLAHLDRILFSTLMK